MRRDDEHRMNAKGVKRLWDKYKYMALVMALGAGLMLWPAPVRRSAAQEAAENRDIQREMEEILGKIEGVGPVRVMLTEESGGERILAEDATLSARGEEYSRKFETVLVDGANGDEVVVRRTISPIYRGALVVCGGGDRPSVRLAVTQAVSALTGLPASRVAVEKWQ